MNNVMIKPIYNSRSGFVRTSDLEKWLHWRVDCMLPAMLVLLVATEAGC